MEKRILIIDDDRDILAGLEALLISLGWEVDTSLTGRDGLRIFETSQPSVVLLDVMLPDISGLDVLDSMKRSAESVPVVVMSGVGTIATAVEAMKLGAETFITKPCDIDTLELALSQAKKLIETQRELAAWRRVASSADHQFPGSSDVARGLDEIIARVAPTTSPVLLEGESGSGKGYVARLIHRRSPRKDRPFVDLNCAGLSRELLESELFGHEKGAFTGAVVAKPGLLEIASTGTVFLDEVGDLELALQARLLKVIEEKRFRRVGGVRDLETGFRLIAATNRNLAADVEEGRFRKDLFYRLNVVRIHVPSLRERKEDIPALAGRFLEILGREIRGAPRKISDRAMQRLTNYRWPGNVRELRNVLERTILSVGGDEIRADDLLLDSSDQQRTSTDRGPGVAAEIMPLENVVNDYVHSAIEATGGNAREAARRLKISPSTLYAKLKKRPPDR